MPKSGYFPKEPLTRLSFWWIPTPFAAGLRTLKAFKARSSTGTWGAGTSKLIGVSTMSDGRTQVPAIPKHINLHQDYEARYWSEKFNVSRDELESWRDGR